MNIRDETTKYYANWLGVTHEQMNGQGIVYVQSYERDKVQKGYSQSFDLYIWITNGLTVVSYGSKLKDNMEQINKIKLGMKADDIYSLISSVFGVSPNRGIKFVFDKKTSNKRKADKLTKGDYFLYRDFFLANNPNCKNTDWLQEYFHGMVARELCYGIKANGILVSANDLPDMPYMEDTVQEIGINTLINFRGKGYAKEVCVSCILGMLDQNICPQWSTARGNTASESLAYSIGFKKLSETITLSL